MITLGSKSDYERMELFMTILNNEFGGSIKELVKSVVMEDIALDKADIAESKDVDHSTMALVTDGCRMTSIQV